jgi:hypothetical protein
MTHNRMQTVKVISAYKYGLYFKELVSYLKFWSSENTKATKSRLDGAVGVASGYGLDDRCVGVRFPVGSRIFSSPRRRDGSGTHSASYLMVTGSTYPGGKAAGA